MSRKLILSFVAVTAIASSVIYSGSSDAMVREGGHGGQPHSPPAIHIGHPHPHFPVHVWRLHERGYIRPVGYVQPVAEGPCTCLTKTYTPEGAVVFQDLCTREMASAPVEGAPVQSSEVSSSPNYAGKTYQDYLAANPQIQATQQKN